MTSLPQIPLTHDEDYAASIERAKLACRFERALVLCDLPGWTFDAHGRLHRITVSPWGLGPSYSDLGLQMGQAAALAIFGDN